MAELGAQEFKELIERTKEELGYVKFLGRWYHSRDKRQLALNELGRIKFSIERLEKYFEVE